MISLTHLETDERICRMGQLLPDNRRSCRSAYRPAVRRAHAYTTPEAGRAFTTPTVLHFSVVLFLAAFIRVPWPSITPPSIIGAIIGVAGVAYVINIVRNIRKQTIYSPVFEDWLFHAILPLAAYLTLFVLAFVAAWNVRLALFGGAAATLTLLFTGIHNAWDAVTWHFFAEPTERRKKRRH